MNREEVEAYLKEIRKMDYTKDIEYGERPRGMRSCYGYDLYITNTKENKIVKFFAQKDDHRVLCSRGAFVDNKYITDLIIPKDCYHRFLEWSGIHCENLERITIPRSIQSIGNGIFHGCWRLKDIFYEGSIDEWKQMDIGMGRTVVTSINHGGEFLTDFIAERGNEILYATNVHFNCKW